MGSRIAEDARQVLEAFNMWRLPVDPSAIAREEGIELAEGQYGAGFDARVARRLPTRHGAMDQDRLMDHMQW